MNPRAYVIHPPLYIWLISLHPSPHFVELATAVEGAGVWTPVWLGLVINDEQWRHITLAHDGLAQRLDTMVDVHA
ncbi:uncharacterized protein Z519_11717 [Cladophialophora bantiana CBS 173.52]|uniref:Uncharacterized protein n=1 Tax=Cladophialophora bantiana (strain ATCC 10958 / CBS 173.52 / CDC B-1940 / NIH 8579) TaxID=1442370 RepID=A0A0D2H343_CLAB1|nr:uncharacterized protein Z519_11717 [Cladophialophora bantiana CBS 173.52]KIW87743.1 hypothetical protein Z519_11717 [Cladophialophora bantiana CBS 173.52]